MDDSQTAFAAQYPSYSFDLDMMKVCVFSRDSDVTDVTLTALYGTRWRS